MSNKVLQKIKTLNRARLDKWHNGKKKIRKLLSRITAKSQKRDHSEAQKTILRAHAPGPHFEQTLIGDESLASQARARLFAFYLPQFYPFEENDRWWGAGFTEWRNVTRALPRFEGHLQPRLPRDLGFYDLRNIETIKEQIRMARRSGVAGFCYYYYWFSGRRLLDRPLDILLRHSEIDFPFCLMWANESWTRRWDGQDHNVLMKQEYHNEDDTLLIDDLARYFKDSRYERIHGRPLFIIYRAAVVPDFKHRLSHWRRLFAERHDLQPLVLMAQTHKDIDPLPYGLDGAIEFPPHKLFDRLPHVSDRKLKLLDPEFSGTYMHYDDLVRRSLSIKAPAFPLIRTLVPSWDNEARKPSCGLGLIEADPQKYENWLSALADQAVQKPFQGVPYVFVNAWNEWAEGAVLEPDLYHGAAYLNATFRALTTAAHSISYSKQ
ncbi:MAG: glycoside hydrolase family 99-like domain-containing protein [Pseudomonadales bacterium]|jgi:hypothetical protein|nr:glycoside hydrolase family 99-like domain-containing protein [Pseudomonadales bacterium]